MAARDSSPGLVACLEDTTLALYPEASDTQVIGVVVGSDGVERTLLTFLFDSLEDSVERESHISAFGREMKQIAH